MPAAQIPPPPRFVQAGRVPARPAAHRRKPAAPRMNSESYFQAAFEILAEAGPEGVTATNMCDRLGVTKGSFYYHFYSMPEFVEAFVAYWEHAWQVLLEDFGREPDPLRRMGMVTTVVAGMSHEAEAALRAWGHSNPVIAEAQLRIDSSAEDLTGAMIAPFVAPELLSVHTAQLISVGIGLQHRSRPVDRELYLRATINLIELICPVRGTVEKGPEGVVVEFHPVD
ncbi:MAG: TetR/AcrR family transcriptional regulator [Sporichthyaceae bacterium]